MPYDELITTLNDYDMGVFVLPPVNFSYAHALPNKFFDFVQARLGVIVGPSPELGPTVDQYGLGKVTTDWGAEALAAAIDSLTPEEVREFKGQRRPRAAHELSAEEAVGPWLRTVQRLVAGGLPMTQSLLILSFSDISADARVLKQVAAFRDRYEVTTLRIRPAPEGVADHVQLPSDQEVWRYSRALLMLRQYARAYRQNGAVRAASAALDGRRFDVVLANDVDAVPLALSLEPRLGVHADLHEFAPAQKSELLRWRLFRGAVHGLDLPHLGDPRDERDHGRARDRSRVPASFRYRRGSGDERHSVRGSAADRAA